jgi:hypothetical protein
MIIKKNTTWLFYKTLNLLSEANTEIILNSL